MLTNFISKISKSIPTPSLIHTIHEPEISNRTVVLFIHGLEGDHIKTWDFGSNLWQDTIISADPHVAIKSLQYYVSRTQWRDGSMRLKQRAINILEILIPILESFDRVVIICHSYGGLLTKQMIYESISNEDDYGEFVAKVEHIVFLSTPHLGSSIARLYDSLGFFLRSSTAIKELKYNNEDLQDLSQWFRDHFDELMLSIKVYYEEKNTHGLRIVDRSSSNPSISDVSPVPLDCDHIDIAKLDENQNDHRAVHLRNVLDRLKSTNDDSGKNGNIYLRRLIGVDDDQLENLIIEFEAQLNLEPENIDLRIALEHAKRARSIVAMRENSTHHRNRIAYNRRESIEKALDSELSSSSSKSIIEAIAIGTIFAGTTLLARDEVVTIFCYVARALNLPIHYCG